MFSSGERRLRTPTTDRLWKGLPDPGDAGHKAFIALGDKEAGETALLAWQLEAASSRS